MKKVHPSVHKYSIILRSKFTPKWRKLILQHKRWRIKCITRLGLKHIWWSTAVLRITQRALIWMSSKSGELRVLTSPRIYIRSQSWKSDLSIIRICNRFRTHWPVNHQYRRWFIDAPIIRICNRFRTHCPVNHQYRRWFIDALFLSKKSCQLRKAKITSMSLQARKVYALCVQMKTVVDNAVLLNSIMWTI